MRCFATCAFGVEALVRDALVALGCTGVRAQDARVYFDGDRRQVIDANLWLRCADRVFVELAAFDAHTFAQLFDGVRAMPWHRLLPRDAKFTVTGKSALSKLASVRDLQAIVKKAIADALCAHYGYARCPESGQAYNVEVGMLRDVATIAMNTSGAGLNRRGYRDLSAAAPLRETLAAAMVTLAHYTGGETLIDPCCGSGTIAIEAAMIAAHIAPGLLRTFAFDGWRAWQKEAALAREAARQQRRAGGFPHVLASDIDPKCVSMARRHAQRAGVNGLISFAVADVRAYVPPMDSGVVVTNPPYGERLDAAQAREVAQALGRWKRDYPRFGVFALSANPRFEAEVGLPAARRRKLYNGAMRCDLYMYMRGRRR